MKSWMNRRRAARKATVAERASDAAEMHCIELVELLTDYLEGAMAPTEAQRLDAHLAKCTACTSVLAQFREVIRLSGRLADDSIARLVPERREPLVAAFRAWAAERA